MVFDCARCDTDDEACGLGGFLNDLFVGGGDLLLLRGDDLDCEEAVVDYVRWGEAASRPVTALVERAAVERDPAFRHVEQADGVADDSGTEGWKRSGRTLVTPSFIVGPGKVYAWVRGGCRTYAAVDSHLMIRGPLHGQLLKDHPPAAEWHWIEHDNGSAGEPACLFSFDDEPALRALGLWHEERG